MQKNILPYQATITLNHKVTFFVGDISYKLGRLNLIRPNKLSRDQILSNISSLFLYSEKYLHSSIRKAIKSNSFKEESYLAKLAEFYRIFNEIDPFKVDFFKIYKTHFGEFVSLREEKEIEGLSFSLPAPSKINSLMKDLFNYLKNSQKKIHPLVAATTIYYLVYTIHPLKENNLHLALLYAKSILKTYDLAFLSLNLEEEIRINKVSFVEALNNSIGELDLIYFSQTFLDLVQKSIEKESKKRLTQITPTKSLNKLLSLMEEDEYYSGKEMMALLNLKNRVSFLKHYLTPGLKLNLLEQLNPLSPRDRNQKYKKKVQL